MIAVGEPDFNLPPYSGSIVNKEILFNGTQINDSSHKSYTSDNNLVNRGDIPLEELQQTVRNILLTDQSQSSSSSFNENQEHNDNQNKYSQIVLKNEGTSEINNNFKAGTYNEQNLSTASGPASAARGFGSPMAMGEIHTRRIAISQPIQTIQYVQEESHSDAANPSPAHPVSH